jgi:putative heme degradation protein
MTMITDNPTVPAERALLQDPAALRQAWAELVTAHPHLHGPEAAARLGVPEAALLAARLGHGAVELQPDLPALLAPCGQWGKLLLAARNRLGVALLIMDDAQVSPTTAGLQLRTAQHVGEVAALGVHRCFFFEERDHHGHTFSLNWFDASGHVIGRLFLMSKSGREIALPHLMAHALPQATPFWTPGAAVALPLLPSAMPQGELLPLTGPQTEHPSAPLAADAQAIQTRAEAAVLHSADAPSMQLWFAGPGLAVRYQGPLAKVSRTAGAVHASDAACKLHLRMAACVQMQQLQRQEGGQALVLSDGAGGVLVLQAGPGAADSVAWLAQWHASLNPTSAEAL